MMKNLLARFFAVICLLLVTISNYAQQGAPCDDLNAPYPHPTICEYFFRCDNGVKVLDVCPAGLHFNPSLKVCDWPNTAGCTVEGGTLPGVEITCNSGSYGRCYTLQMKDCWPIPVNTFKCTFTGSQNDSCSWLEESYCNYI